MNCWMYRGWWLDGGMVGWWDGWLVEMVGVCGLGKLVRLVGMCKLVLAMLAFVASKLWSWCDAQLASESVCGRV